MNEWIPHSELISELITYTSGSHDVLLEQNISGANQPLRANYENFNLDHQINIQGARGIG